MPWCNRGGCLDDLPVLVVVVALLAGVRLDGVAVRELVAVVTILRVEAKIHVVLPVHVAALHLEELRVIVVLALIKVVLRTGAEVARAARLLASHAERELFFKKKIQQHAAELANDPANAI